MTEEVFQGRHVFGAAPAGGGGSGFRGLSLRNTSAATFSGVDDQSFDTVDAETDGIRTTGTHTFGSVTVGVGNGGEVPAGMAGFWQLSANNQFSGAAGGLTGVEFDIVVNNFSPFFPASLIPDTVFPGEFHLAVAAVVVELAEGDVVWADVLPNVGTIDAGLGATLTMIYLGPVVVPGS